MKKFKRIIAAVSAAAALSTSAVIASAQWRPWTPYTEKEMQYYVEDINREINSFIDRYRFDAEMSGYKKKKDSIGYNHLWYFDPTLKPLFDDYFYFNEMDISRIVSGYPEDWQRKDWLDLGISGFISREKLNAFCTYADDGEYKGDIIVAYQHDDTQTREKIERFIADSNYSAAEGVDIKFIAAGENSKQGEKITDKYEIVLLLSKFIRDEGLKYVSTYLESPDSERVSVSYSATGWHPESREEGRMTKTLNAVLDYAKSANIDESLLYLFGTDDLLVSLTEHIEETKPITDAGKIISKLSYFVKNNALDAEIVEIDKSNEMPTDLPAYLNTETAGNNSSGDKRYAGVCYADPAVREKIEAFIKEENIDSSRVLMYDHFDTDGRVDHEAIEIRKFMRENDIRAYQKWRQRGSELTICYWSVDKEAIKLVKDFAEKRYYDKTISIKYKQLTKHSGKITDADEAYAMLYDFCFRDNLYLADSLVYSPLCDKMTLYIGDDWSGIDSESAIDKFIKQNKIDSTLIDKVYIGKSIEDDTVPPTTKNIPVTQPTLETTPPAEKVLKGDADLNGEVSLSDVTTVSKYILNGKLFPFASEMAKSNADMNYDDEINSLDVAVIMAINLG